MIAPGNSIQTGSATACDTPPSPVCLFSFFENETPCAARRCRLFNAAPPCPAGTFAHLFSELI
jgi:hypothetical protein